MKYIANLISCSRIIMSVILLIPITFSIPFNVVYIYCGVSDVLDGFVARISKSESEIEDRLDSVADIIFVVVAMIKIVPVLNFNIGIIIWIVLIALVKVVNVIVSYANDKRIALPHTIANKVTGFLLFITPFIIVNNNSIIFEIAICCIATFAAVQEWQQGKSD